MTATLTIREHQPSSHYRGIAPANTTLAAAIRTLYAEGHIGQRKCAVVLTPSGTYSPQVETTHTGRAADDHVRSRLSDPAQEFATLSVPEGCADEARAIVEEHENVELAT